jgi:hypothetical protein
MNIKSDSTMFAALYGKLSLHLWRDPIAASSDAYSLFVARASAMGWLADATGAKRSGIWGMNDAGQDHDAKSQDLQRIWFQVSLRESLPLGQPVPVQPFLSCAGDVVARIGVLRLDTVQLLLPVQSLTESPNPSLLSEDVMVLLQNMSWFADCNSQTSTNVQITMDSGQNPAIHSSAPKMFQLMQEIKQNVFVCNSFSLADDAMVLKPSFIDELWLGPAQYRATFHGTLLEWSLDALGWIAAFLASLSSQCGVSTPVVFTVDRSEETNL